ncbi:hypothetical protein B0J17DRAFT_48151 [Rhizoctonia solani]|nr:hypothetical protein B0J17DRAFT_48151 [Rhizoctonia solani]
MFTLAQPAYHFYNPYEELAIQQELQRRRQMEAYLRRQREAEEMERRRREYEAAVRAEYERRREAAELERLRQAELQRHRQAQQLCGRHSMYDGGLESLFDALYGGRRRAWEESRSNIPEQDRPAHTAAPSTTPSPFPVPTTSSTPAPVSTSSEPEPTAEPEFEVEPQVDTAPSHAAVQSILSSFTTLRSEFKFPTQLDFLPGSSKLAYTTNNAPLHGYEHALTGLLTRLDAVESYGDDGVRRARKEAVKTIEKELERLDEMKAETWNRASEPETEVSEPVETSVDPAYVPLPEDCDEEDAEMEGVVDMVNSEGLPTAKQLSVLEPLVTAGLDSTEPVALPDLQCSNSSENLIDASPAMSKSPAPDTEHVIPNDAALNIPLPNSPNLEPVVRLPTSSLPPEANGSGSDPDLELEQYVDVAAMSTSEDQDTNLEEVEKDRGLELMRDWDLDF